MMKCICLFVTLTTLNHVVAETCILNLEPREDAWDKALHKDLRKNYDPDLPPSNQSCVVATILLHLKSFVFDETEGIFTIKVWTRIRWTDERLKWSPDEYGGVKQVVMYSSHIWKPAFKLIHGVYPPFFDMFYSDCSISSEGKALCVAQVVYDTFCSSKLKEWPYDVQNCTLDFGDDDTYGITQFEFPDRIVAMVGAEYGPGWTIVDVHTETNVSSRVKLSVSMTLERQAYGLVVILVTPCIILSLLIFVCTLLSPKGFVRLGLSCFCLICHFIFTGTIDEFLPKHSADTPVILLFAKGSTIVSITSVLFTYALSVMTGKTTVPFAWVTLIVHKQQLLVHKLTDTFGKYLLVRKWIDISETEDINVKNKEIWTSFANILNSIYMAIVVIVYICLFSVYMPKQPTFEY